MKKLLLLLFYLGCLGFSMTQKEEVREGKTVISETGKKVLNRDTAKFHVVANRDGLQKMEEHNGN